MAMVTPIVSQVNAFDATNSHNFTFIVSGGNQVVKNKIIIRNNSTNAVVYQNTVTSYSFEQEVPANTLTNGTEYTVSFITYDINNITSNESSAVYFKCLSQATLTFNNIPTGNIINASSYMFSVTYTQAQSEALSSLKFVLYDALDNVVGESPIYSGNISPMTFTYTFSGMENGVIYKIGAIGKTEHGMDVNSTVYTLIVRFYYPSMYSRLTLENMCRKGGVRLESHFFTAKGEVNPFYAVPFCQYETNKKCLYVPQSDNYVEFNDGYSIGSNFTIYIHMMLGNMSEQVNNRIFLKIGTDSNGFTLSHHRGIPSGQTVAKDYFILKGYRDGVLTVNVKSGYMTMVSNNDRLSIVLRKNGSSYSINATKTTTIEDVFDYGDSNISPNKQTTLLWSGDSYPAVPSFTTRTDYIDDIFPLNYVKIQASVISEIYVTQNVTETIDYGYHSEWDYDTILFCSFEDTLEAGNISGTLDTIKYIKIKRKKQNSFNWVSLWQKSVNSFADLSIFYEDYFVPSLYNAEYAIVPILQDGTEGTYITNRITTAFHTVTVSDLNKAFNFDAQINYSNVMNNKNIGQYTTLKSQYPITSVNNNVNYKSGTITVTCLGNNYELTNNIDRLAVKAQIDSLIEFITDNKAKVIHDWNGNIFIVRFVGNPTINFIQNFGNGIASVTASWVEQGKYDSQSDLYINGLTNVIE